MPSRFDQRFNAHSIPVLNREHGVEVTLRRGGLTTAAFTARRTTREYESMGAAVGLDIKVERRAYLVPLAKCVFNGVTVEPRVGDIVKEGTDEWVLHHPNDGVPAAEQVNEYEWQVYTKAVE